MVRSADGHTPGKSVASLPHGECRRTEEILGTLPLGKHFVSLPNSCSHRPVPYSQQGHTREKRLARITMVDGQAKVVIGLDFGTTYS